MEDPIISQHERTSVSTGTAKKKRKTQRKKAAYSFLTNIPLAAGNVANVTSSPTAQKRQSITRDNVQQRQQRYTKEKPPNISVAPPDEEARLIAQPENSAGSSTRRQHHSEPNAANNSNNNTHHHHSHECESSGRISSSCSTRKQHHTQRPSHQHSEPRDHTTGKNCNASKRDHFKSHTCAASTSAVGANVDGTGDACNSNSGNNNNTSSSSSSSSGSSSNGGGEESTDGICGCQLCLHHHDPSQQHQTKTSPHTAPPALPLHQDFDHQKQRRNDTKSRRKGEDFVPPRSARKKPHSADSTRSKRAKMFLGQIPMTASRDSPEIVVQAPETKSASSGDSAGPSDSADSDSPAESDGRSQSELSTTPLTSPMPVHPTKRQRHSLVSKVHPDSSMYKVNDMSSLQGRMLMSGESRKRSGTNVGILPGLLQPMASAITVAMGLQDNHSSTPSPPDGSVSTLRESVYRVHMMPKNGALPALSCSYIRRKNGSHLNNVPEQRRTLNNNDTDGAACITHGSNTSVDGMRMDHEHIFTHSTQLHDDALSSYDPYFLDNPELRHGKRRKVINLPGIITSNIPFVKSKVLKRELNEQFRAMHPSIDRTLSLSKIRNLKKKMLDFASSSKALLEVSTVALAVVFLEKLILKGRVHKNNRRLITSTCVLMAFKMNHDVGESMRKEIMDLLFDALEDSFGTSRKRILDMEFTVFSWLDFDLDTPPEHVVAHMKRLLSASNETVQGYFTQSG